MRDNPHKNGFSFVKFVLHNLIDFIVYISNINYNLSTRQQTINYTSLLFSLSNFLIPFEPFNRTTTTYAFSLKRTSYQSPISHYIYTSRNHPIKQLFHFLPRSFATYLPTPTQKPALALSPPRLASLRLCTRRGKKKLACTHARVVLAVSPR